MLSIRRWVAVLFGRRQRPGNAARRRRGPVTVAAEPARLACGRDDFEPTRLYFREDDVDGWLPPAQANRATEVSTQPMDTLPAELQNEFASPRFAPPPASRT